MRIWRLALGLMVPVAARSQAPVALTDASCPACAIDEKVLAVLGGPDTSLALTAGSRVARLSDGRMVVGPIREKGKMALVDAQGHLVRTIGQRGQGPGDFATIGAFAVGKADSLFVWDTGNNRVAIYDRTMKFVKTVANPVPRAHAFAALANGQLLFTAATDAPRFHLVDRAGKLVRSFGREVIVDRGAEARRYDSGTEPAPVNTRLIGVSATGVLWAARMNRLDVSQWRTDGAQVQRLVGEPGWFPPWTESVKVDPQYTFTTPLGTTSPLTEAVQVDEVGRVWVYVLLADPAWRPPPPPQRGSAPPPFDAAKRWDMMLQVIDPARRVMLVNRRFDMRTVPVAGCLCAAKYLEDAGGLLSLEIVGLSVRTK